jgi:predicted Zn-dependent protease
LPIEGGAGVGNLSIAIANSNGVSTYDKGTVVECSLATLAQENGEVTPLCFEFSAEGSLSVAPEWVGKEAARLAVSTLKPKPVETKNYPVIFTQLALQDLL